MRWRPGARWWSLQCSPDPIAGLGEGDGVREAELEMEGLEGKGREGEVEEREGREGKGVDPTKFGRKSTPLIVWYKKRFITIVVKPLRSTIRTDCQAKLHCTPYIYNRTQNSTEKIQQTTIQDSNNIEQLADRRLDLRA